MIHVDGFFEFTMEKCILYIQLINVSRFGKSDTENSANWNRFNNWDKIFSIINVNLLTCIITYKSGFMPLKWTIIFFFCLKIHIDWRKIIGNWIIWWWRGGKTFKVGVGGDWGRFERVIGLMGRMVWEGVLGRWAELGDSLKFNRGN